MTDPVPEITDLQNKIDQAEENRIKLAQLEIRIAEMEAKIRRRSTNRLIQATIGVWLVILACWYVGYTFYTLLH